MSKDSLSGKLAVILHADIADSTVLVQQDERLAHERIQDAFRRFSETIEKYQGQVRELRGDALLADFERPSDAVTAALAFQADHASHIEQLNDDIRPVARIGIAMGEVIIADNTVTGSGVVLAQRVEQLSEPGGVCITAAIHEGLPKRLPFDQADMGEQQVKGFDEPVRVYGVKLRAGESIPPPQKIHQPKVSPKPLRLAVAVTVTALVIGSGLLYWFNPWEPREELASISRMAYPLPDKPSIAVLPFTNMSDDPQQEYFADGMTDDLITDLSKISGLFVIARNSTFTYKGKSVKVRQVAEELGVRYVLEGSVRRSGEQMRVNAQLIDATTGGHVWADRYDGNVTDIFPLQDTFIRKIVKALAVNLSEDEQEEIILGQTSNIEAREVFQKGWESYLRYSADDNAAAISQFEMALEIDPEYGRAYAALALVYLRGCQLQWNKPLKMSVGAANAKSQTYLYETERYPSTLAIIAASGIHIHNNRHAEAITEATRAIARDPNNPEAYIAMAWAMITTGRPGPGLELVERAMRLSPTYPNYYVLARGIAYFAMDDLEKAADVFAEALERDPGAIELVPLLAATYAHLGQREDARASLLLWKPGASLRVVLQNIQLDYLFPYKWSGDRKIEDRLNDGLYIAAMPLETTVSSLGAAMKHGNIFERRRAITDLGRFGSAAASAIPTIIEALGAKELATRNEAIIALGKIGPAAELAIPALTIMQGEGGIVEYHAGEALMKIKGK
jgi:adenylate cyclase